MIEISRAVEGISLNGKEYLLDENGSSMKFGNRESAIQFLKTNGYENFSTEELDDSFFFDETVNI